MALNGNGYPYGGKEVPIPFDPEGRYITVYPSRNKQNAYPYGGKEVPIPFDPEGRCITVYPSRSGQEADPYGEEQVQMSFDEKGRWITVHPGGKGPKADGSGEKKGTHVLIDSKGRVLAGMGGKHTGQKIGEIRKDSTGAGSPARGQTAPHNKAGSKPNAPKGVRAFQPAPYSERIAAFSRTPFMNAKNAGSTAFGCYGTNILNDFDDEFADCLKLFSKTIPSSLSCREFCEAEQALTALLNSAVPSPTAKEREMTANLSLAFIRQAAPMLEWNRFREEHPVVYADTDLGREIAAIRELAPFGFSEDTLREVGSRVLPHLAGLPLLATLRKASGAVASAWDEYQQAKNPVHRVQDKKELQKHFDNYLEIRDIISSTKSQFAESVRDLVSTMRQTADRNRDDLLHTIQDPGAEARVSKNWEKKYGKVLPVKEMTKQVVADALGMLPKEWAASFGARGKLSIGYCARGFHRSGDGKTTPDLICLSSPNDKQECLRVALHEFGHQVESTYPGVVKAEAQFFERRTRGEVWQKLRDLTGQDFDEDEVTKEDKFLCPYIGKDYGGSGFELLSVGLEMLYTGPGEILNDPDYAKLILGIVALI